jgi:hypothetical protein
VYAAVIDGRLITTALVVVIALVLVVAGSRVISARTKDAYHRYYLRKTIR